MRPPAQQWPQLALAMPRPFPRSTLECDPPRQGQLSCRGLEPSGSREPRAQGTGRPAPPPAPTPNPRGRRTAPSGVSLGTRRPRGGWSRRARVGAASVSSREGRVGRRSDPLPAGPPQLPPPRGAGPRPGAGRRAGAALFPASPEAPLALRWEPSPRDSRIPGAVRRKETAAGGERREGDGPRD